eukprot:CAMPEP_0180360018 /NCGR_PEP_ID=MMETSP0989-20121125/11664_1 /TAXON_ID=697907 /ORGANISM="non described non described, Strain CCMP2293" /LENGTH=651 /DNA_ID=CAMNT_0022351151 /DNA_START=46 /DNA_END=1997 /DNA_ORIENTATION=-
MSIRLRELIRAVRACKTLADERDAIAKECAAIRTAFKDEDNPYRHRNVAKLLFIHMLGYPTHFGQMECLKLIAGHRFPEKRIGYLGLMLLLDEDTEVLMLVTNSLKNDLGHTNQFIVGQALCAMGDIGSADMCRDLSGEVEKLLTNTNAYIRKKAVLALLRILRKCPDMVEHYLEKITSLLSDRNHGVLVGTLAMLIEVCETQPEVVPSFRACAPQLLKMLKNLVLSGYAPEHDVSGITDPFVQVKILRALRILAAGNKGTSEAIADLLAQVATNTESAKNAGNAILYECVLTIVGIEADSGLRVLAVNILGRFLLNRDNNIRYVGLNTLAQVAGADLKAIQRHRGTVVDCLKDPDISIRRRALDLVYLLVNGTNVKPLVNELLAYLAGADVEFKEDLTSKICSLVAKQSPSKKFQTDTIVKVLVDAGDYVQDQVIASLPALIAAETSLQAYTVHTLFRAIEDDCSKPKLNQIAVWCTGEYGELLVAPFRPPPDEGEPMEAVPAARVIKLIKTMLISSLQTLSVKQYLLTALVKLYSRLAAQQPEIRALLEENSQSVVVEIQQRAVEYSLLTQMDAAKLRELTDHMPTPDDEAVSAPKGGAKAPVAARPAAPPVDDLLSLLDDSPAAPVSSTGGPSMVDLMGDIFGAAPSS